MLKKRLFRERLAAKRLSFFLEAKLSCPEARKGMPHGCYCLHQKAQVAYQQTQNNSKGKELS